LTGAPVPFPFAVAATVVLVAPVCGGPFLPFQLLLRLQLILRQASVETRKPVKNIRTNTKTGSLPRFYRKRLGESDVFAHDHAPRPPLAMASSAEPLVFDPILKKPGSLKKNNRQQR